MCAVCFSALQAIEDVKARQANKLQDDLDEYKEMRKAEKDKEANEIEDLKRKRVSSGATKNICIFGGLLMFSGRHSLLSIISNN